MFKKILSLFINSHGKIIEFNKGTKFIKTIASDYNSVNYQKNLLLSKNMYNGIMHMYTSKTLKTNITLEGKKPQLKLEEVKIVIKENKIIR